MPDTQIYESPLDVAYAAASSAVEILKNAILAKDSAVWVLAGGTSPMLAYEKISSDFSGAIDWSKVTILIGDERMVSLDDSSSNWGTILKIFDTNEALSKIRRIIPNTSLAVRLAATDYQKKLQNARVNEFDLLWIGVGEDGHTLSLFPGNDAFIEKTKDWVVPVFDSPKPPSERITLSLSAIEATKHLIIFAVGAAKKNALAEARLYRKLPIASVAQIAETHGAVVEWLYDKSAIDVA